MATPELLQLMEAFEERNNLSISIHICSDGSGTIEEFWENEEIEEFNSLESLSIILTTTNYKKGENGYCISPIERI